MPSSLVIRADANTRMGTGHVMRCLALAQAWQDAGGTARFVCAEVPDGLATRLVAEGMVLHRLNEMPGSHADAERTAALAQRIGTDWVVEDGYHFGADYQRAIKDAGLRLLAIDDYGHAEHYVADLVLNQNIYADESLYPNREPTTQLLLGTDYVLLRREFWPWREWRRTTPNVAGNILVTMGGGDPDNQTLKAIRAIQQITDIDLSVVVVVGGGNPHLATLEEAIAGSPSIRLVQNATNMPELIVWADIAVSGVGSTCWEFLFMGLPTVGHVLAENQRSAALFLSRQKMVRLLTDSWYLDIHQLESTLAELLHDVTWRQHVSQHGPQIVDGLGTSKVVEVMLKVVGSY